MLSKKGKIHQGWLEKGKTLMVGADHKRENNYKIALHMNTLHIYVIVPTSIKEYIIWYALFIKIINSQY